MTATTWVVAIAVVMASVVTIWCAPVIHRATRRRQRNRSSSFGGLGSGLDSVWRPTAEVAHADWENQVQLPAPAPIPADKGRIRAGRIIIAPADRD